MIGMRESLHLLKQGLRRKRGFALCMLLLVGACSQGEWPKLSDKLPDPADRDRAADQIVPTGAPEAIPSGEEPLRPEEAAELIQAIQQETDTLKEAYMQALDRYEQRGAVEADSALAEERHLWLEMQLKLTRLSQSASRLNRILYAGDSRLEPFLGDAKRLKDKVEHFIALEKTRKPPMSIVG